MPYIVFKQPGIRIDLKVEKKFHVNLVSSMRRLDCSYRKEIEKTENGQTWVILKDVTSNKPYQLGELLGLFFSMDWVDAVSGNDKKFYVMINQKRSKKNGGKNWKKVYPGREGRAAEGSSGDIQHGECVGPATDGDPVRDSGDDGVCAPEGE